MCLKYFDGRLEGSASVDVTRWRHGLDLAALVEDARAQILSYAAEQLKPQAVTLADARGIGCVRVDLAVLRGEREPELTLFAV